MVTKHRHCIIKSTKKKYKIKANPDCPYQTNPTALGVSALEISHLSDNCKDFFHAVFLVCPHSLVFCNPIPKKAFFSLGICVPWCPRVSHGCSKPIKCCSGVAFPPDCQPAFFTQHTFSFHNNTLPLCKLWLHYTLRPDIVQHCHRLCHCLLVVNE